MSVVKPHLYINSRGYYVTRHSYSGGDTFNYCARKYYLERVQGWSKRKEHAAAFFGTALEKAITHWHQRKQNTPASVEEFKRLWLEHKDKPYEYSKSDLDWDRLNATGIELVRLYAIRYPEFPYVVNNPQDFQVETTFEIFPGTKLAGLEFTSYIDLLAEVKATSKPVIIDMKTSGKDVPELTVLDPQLRSYAWVRSKPGSVLPTYVAFLWFRKMGRTISKGDRVTILEPCANFQPGDDAIVLGKDLLGGLIITPDQAVADTMDETFVGESKAAKEGRDNYARTNGRIVPEKAITKQRVQFKMVEITAESAEDIGRSIKRDMINIAAANEKEFWPMQSGVRFPNEKCPNCAMRGICSENPNLRDSLLVRKQMDELDFAKESE